LSRFFSGVDTLEKMPKRGVTEVSSPLRKVIWGANGGNRQSLRC
jgi:hypothetical protein